MGGPGACVRAYMGECGCLCTSKEGEGVGVEWEGLVVAQGLCIL